MYSPRQDIVDGGGAVVRGLKWRLPVTWCLDIWWSRTEGIQGPHPKSLCLLSSWAPGPPGKQGPSWGNRGGFFLCLSVRLQNYSNNSATSFHQNQVSHLLPPESLPPRVPCHSLCPQVKPCVALHCMQCPLPWAVSAWDRWTTVSLVCPGIGVRCLVVSITLGQECFSHPWLNMSSLGPLKIYSRILPSKQGHMGSLVRTFVLGRWFHRWKSSWRGRSQAAAPHRKISSCRLRLQNCIFAQKYTPAPMAH